MSARDRRPRIAVAGIAIESSALAAHRAGLRDFVVQEGDVVLTTQPFLLPGTPLGDAAEWIGVLTARSIPGGRVLRDVYEGLTVRILEGLAAQQHEAPFDGVHLLIHGAMSVDGMDDAEADLVDRIRGVVGPTALIGAAMDLHGNVSERLVRQIDLPTCYRLAPHEDVDETRERSARNLLGWLARDARPVRAWVSVPLLLTGEQSSTRVEPARSLYGSLADIERLPGVTDASVWIGYAWADEPRCR